MSLEQIVFLILVLDGPVLGLLYLMWRKWNERN
jgi:hypothetical protein